jgi:Glycosyl hydrolase family 20, domain 2
MSKILLLVACCAASAVALDLQRASVKAGAADQKAATVLIEEVEKRTQIRWPANASGSPVITLERGQGPAEGYTIRTSANGVTISGNDARGVLFGAGRLLRTLDMRPGAVTLADNFHITTAPKYPLRGHQLGYRPKTNAYDAWSVPVWDQYIRDLAIFGSNAIELIPPRSDDAADSPHFPLPPMRMMAEMSRIANEYSQDVWIWYPAMDKDYSDPKTVEFALNEWAEVFKKLPRIDAVFVPGGDPGHTQPKYLMALLEKETQVLHKYHPKAQMWVSPQSFDAAWIEEFIGILKREPAWLSGIVFGPQIRISLPKLRELTPKRYPIRHYPDITHSRQAQYPVPDWDLAYSVTEAREVINPRPVSEASIFRLLAPYTNGFLTYSEGCNDDVNKFVWSALGWDPDADVTGILREFSRYFISPRLEEGLAQGLLALERNWRGPLLTNGNVYSTLAQFQDMERTATPAELGNWRFQQAVYRAYYDAYVRSRLLYETQLEEEAMMRLRRARITGSLQAMNEAEQILNRAVDRRVSEDWRARIFTLAEALFQSIRMQLSVPLYKAISVDRGASLDTVDAPLNNRPWLQAKFADLRAMPDEPPRLNGIDEIVNWTDPGPGGFYDDLGNLARQPHLVRGLGADKDPAFLESSLVGFGGRTGYRTSWRDHAEALNDAPLRMHYDGLDPSAHYKIRIVYAGDSPTRKIRLDAGGVPVHPWFQKPVPVKPVEFDIPPQATAKGVLDLSWNREPGQGGNGRGNQVAEVWLIKK